MATHDNVIIKLKATLDERLLWGRDQGSTFGLKWSKDGVLVLYDGVSSDEALRCMTGIPNDKTPLLSQLLDWGFYKTIGPSLNEIAYQKLGFYRSSSIVDIIKRMCQKDGNATKLFDSFSNSFESDQSNEPCEKKPKIKQCKVSLDGDLPHQSSTSNDYTSKPTISTPSPIENHNGEYRASLIKNILASIDNLKVWNKERQVSLPQLRAKLREIICSLLDNEIDEETRVEQKKLKELLEQDVDKNPIYVGWVLGAVEAQLKNLI